MQSLAVKYFCETAHSRREHSPRRFSSTEWFQEKDALEDINPKWSSFSNDSTEKVSTFTSQSARAYCNKLIPTLALSVEEFTAFDINVRFNGNESSMSIFLFLLTVGSAHGHGSLIERHDERIRYILSSSP